MYAIYRMNAEELDAQFLESLRTAFKNKEIELVVSTADETEYLLRSSANREHLLKAMSELSTS